MSESADYDPSPWKGVVDNFASARQAYQHHASRTYDSVANVSAASVNIDEYVAASLTTDAEVPIVIVLDTTGSMGDWPATICSKLPYLDNEMKEYYGDGKYAVSFCCIDDICTTAIPFQCRPFVSGTAMKDELEKLKHTKNGGGNMKESYDVAGLYYARNCEMPQAIKPLIVFIGDEGLYEFVDRAKGAEWARVKLTARLSREDLFDELKQKFSVYVIRKPYDSGSGDYMSPTDKMLREQWAAVLGEDHVADLPDPNRVVDVLFGIFAQETGKIAYFQDELKDRQLKDAGGAKKVAVVLKSLATIHHDPAAIAKDPSLKKLPAPSKPGASITRGKAGGASAKRSKSLLD